MNRAARESLDDENIIDHPSFRMTSAPGNYQGDPNVHEDPCPNRAPIRTIQGRRVYRPPPNDDRAAESDTDNRISDHPEPRDAEMQTIELRETPNADGPPVLSGPNVITYQPPRGEPRNPRRPIQISSMDWMSTPRTEFNAFSGSHFLANLEQLELQQIVDLSTLLGRSERGCQYRVKIPHAETVFLAMESRDDGNTSYLGCSRIYHPNLSLNVLDQCGETAFVMKISARWTYTLQRLHQMTVESASPFGSIEENFSVLGPSFTIYDEMHRPLCHISGPKICGCCMYKDAQYQELRYHGMARLIIRSRLLLVRRNNVDGQSKLQRLIADNIILVVSTDSTYQVASLMHQWDDAAHDYTTLVTFPLDTDIKLKSLLLGAALLVEYLYYFRLRRSRSL